MHFASGAEAFIGSVREENVRQCETSQLTTGLLHKAAQSFSVTAEFFQTQQEARALGKVLHKDWNLLHFYLSLIPIKEQTTEKMLNNCNFT